jgi:L-cysteine S-thiosulfotransferase
MRSGWRGPLLCGLLAAGCATLAGAQGASGSAPPVATADTLPQPLTATPGNAERGRAIIANRQVGLCLLCHTGPFPEERFQGNMAPSLAGAGSRWSEGQLRLRISNARQLNPASIMPAYHPTYHPAERSTDPTARVAPALQGRPILDAQQVEDVVAFLSTLRN